MTNFSSKAFSTTTTTSETVSHSQETNQGLEGKLLWIPGVLMGVAMMMFLGVSFYRYHMRFRRKRKLAMEYIYLSQSTKRPRIGAPLCFTNNLRLSELCNSFPLAALAPTEENGDIHVRITNTEASDQRAITQNGFTYSNPTFKNDIGEDGDSDSLTNAEIHSPFENLSAPTVDHAEVDLRLSELCEQCASKALAMDAASQSNRTSVIKSQFAPIDDFTEHRPTFNVGDDFEMMDAFHGPPRERRRMSVDVNRNKRPKDAAFKLRPQFSFHPSRQPQAPPTRSRGRDKSGVFWLDLDTHQHTSI
ncbi:uncharacterized protein LOC124289156 isoform X4 [Haliotis rubra]|uniref:uncharacterized protein LOC124289156 isoform X4 n=1 Tax=Haliotis rubra TaxID=36100 RepID=UPI001EE5C354|nr:uncharacterized protein LOC124289156 isoform X4 [Haliotis rubra]XP_046581722.1 uncharacterized protein LOC124289156 isoform X4 [Haliotis rubra]